MSDAIKTEWSPTDLNTKTIIHSIRRNRCHLLNKVNFEMDEESVFYIALN